MLGSAGQCWAVLGSDGQCWVVLGSAGQSWAVLGSVGQRWHKECHLAGIACIRFDSCVSPVMSFQITSLIV